MLLSVIGKTDSCVAQQLWQQLSQGDRAGESNIDPTLRSVERDAREPGSCGDGGGLSHADKTATLSRSPGAGNFA
jgi:hypothetical protein